MHQGRGAAGTPTTMARGATSRVTTAPAPMIAPSPIVTPGKMTACVPIQTLRPMTMGRDASEVEKSSARGSCVSDVMATWLAMRVSSPMVTPFSV